ncbi:MAG: FAD-binding protein [Dialister invisus]
MDQKFDTIVIGFGKAGKTLAAKLAKQGEKVALIEKDARMYGGTCINVAAFSCRLGAEVERAPAHDFEAQSEYYHVAVQEKKNDNSTPVWPIIIVY